MNTGAISTRYAKALLKYSKENSCLEQVVSQVKAMLSDPESVPSPLEPCLAKFIELLVQRGRMDSLLPIFRSFIDMYHRETGIRRARLTVVEDSQALRDKILALLEKQTGCGIILETVVDPSIVGGFVLEVDGYILDASIRHQLDTIRRQFIISNNRIV